MEPCIVTRPGLDTVYHTENPHQAHVLARQLNDRDKTREWKVVHVKIPEMAWQASASIGVKGTLRGMRPDSVFHESERLPVIDDEILDALGKGKHFAYWSASQPTYNDGDGEDAPFALQWLHVWAQTPEKAQRMLRRIGRERERALLECYRPKVGVIGLDRLPAADRLADTSPIKAPL
jgi:hypothetical protein